MKARRHLSKHVRIGKDHQFAARVLHCVVLQRIFSIFLDMSYLMGKSRLTDSDNSTFSTFNLLFGGFVKNISFIVTRGAWILTGAALIAACSSTPPEFRGKWRPINAYSEVPQELPLQQTYLYYAAPPDRTLKNMLARWAQDSNLTLNYLATSDYTLYGPVADIRAVNLADALSQLNSAYAGQGVRISVDGKQITVTRGSAGGSDAASLQQ